MTVIQSTEGTEAMHPEVDGHLLVIDDDVSICRALSRELKRSGFAVNVAHSADEGFRILRRANTEAVLLDIRLPGISGLEMLPEIRRRWPDVQVVMLTGHGDIDTAVSCMRAGAFDFLQKPCHLGEVEASLRRAVERHRLLEQNRDLKRRLGRGSVGEPEPLIGDSPAMREVKDLIERIAPREVSVIITGESGTGKEVVARQIVAASPRAGAPFFALNCGALSESLLESELFGHERGAFTGADERRLGFFELANEGTILLDEIGEMPMAMQAKMLRLLQFGEFFRVGSAETRHTDVRILAATNRDLSTAVSEGAFREDLFYRLNTVTIHIPPLRDRLSDLPGLVEHLLATRMDDLGQRFTVSPEAIECLRDHTWPGNVRELENALRSAAIMASEGIIECRDLPQRLRGSEPSAGALGDMECSLDEIERMHILQVLDRCDGNKAEAARKLGITKKTLYSKLVLYGRHVRGE